METSARRMYVLPIYWSPVRLAAAHILICSTVFALVGVMLIARPEFIFGRASHETDIPLTDGTGHVMEDVDAAVGVTPAQRVVAVG